MNDVLQDPSGSIWLATDRGLWHWVGSEFAAEFHRFRTVNPTQCLVESGQLLWVGTGDGLVGIDPASMVSRPGPAEMQGVRVHQIASDAFGRMWCATCQGLYRLSVDDQVTQAVPVAGIGQREVYSVAVDLQGRVWAGACGALFSYDQGALREHCGDVLGGREVRALTVDSEGTLWVGLGDAGGVYKLEGETLSQLLPRDGDEPFEVNVIISHPDGEVWIGAENGILRWAGDEVIRIDNHTGLAHDAVQGLYVDREELVWIATRGGGVYQLRSPYVLTYDVYDGLPHPVVQVVLPRPNGEFIVGTASGLCRMNTGGRVIQKYPYLGSVEALYADAVGRLWVGGRSGLTCFTEHDGEQLEFSPLAEMGRVTAIGANDRGGIGVCTNSGLWEIDGNRVTHVPLSVDSLDSHIRLNGCYRDPQGTIYLMTQLGLLKRGAQGLWSVLPSGREVYCMTTDATERTWIGTSQGLMTLESGYCRDFHRRGSPHGKVTDITVDHRGTLWMATPEGLSRFDGTHCTTFTDADGLPCSEVHCVEALSPGVLLVGTSRGLAFVESDRISPSRASPRVAITGFKAGGEHYVITNAHEPLQVPNWQRNISLSFQGIGFRQDQKELRYMSRLAGFEDEDWSAPRRQPSRTYTNLPWGDYEFQVKAVNARGISSDQIASVRFRISLPFWLNPWFIAACAVALSALGVWVLATQRKKRQLQHAAEVATIAKSEFLAKVSHEIRTPLTVILAGIEELADPPQSPSVFREVVELINRNGTHLLGMINDLLDLSKIEAGYLQVRMAPASIPEILMGVDAIMRAGAKRQGLDFRTIYETEIPELIITDPGRLRQTLINLVGNAIKFTSEGHIHTRVRVEEQEEGRRLVFDVEDTGMGIPPERVDMIFDAFEQVESSTARKFAGTGLGLAISKAVGGRL
ncbi:MAG: hypothetical protein KAV82_13080, partial [Phycisphaerae bacterium]|nr:hypothetical protein [Phycisphaerae bacterium]